MTDFLTAEQTRTLHEILNASEKGHVRLASIINCDHRLEVTTKVGTTTYIKVIDKFGVSRNVAIF